MSEIERKTLLQTFLKKKAIAFSEEVPNAPAIIEIVSQLNALEQNDKYYFFDFVKNLKADLFLKNTTIKSLNLDDFISKSDNNNSGTFHDSLEKKVVDEVQLNFLDLFKDLVSNINEHFDVYKGYFILRLENNSLKPYKLIVLYDKSFIVEPIKKKIVTSIPNSVFSTIPDFIEEISKSDTSDTNYLCLLLLMPRINDHEGSKELVNNLNLLISNFSYFENISLKVQNKTIQNDYHRYIDKDEFLEELEFVNCTLLSNGAFKHEEEKIVKKLATNFKTPLVLYKTLKAGNSGSKVIEIRPKKELGEQYEKRYIIKYGEIDNERKIKIEKGNFDEFIRGYKGFNDYECHYSKTLTHEGILYGYAIADTEKESYSFNDILNKPENPFHSNKINLIDNLFNDLNLFDTWANTVEKKKLKVSELYSEYINKDKVLEQIGFVLNKNPAQLNEDELIKNFNLIWNHEGDFNVKICHGDLHTDNFFVDNKGIYLIDFGFTGKKHAIIDHTSLECSIKFKHFPYYISIGELNGIEEELILDNSFQSSTKFTKTTRPDLIEMLEIVKRIRYNSTRLFLENNSISEYLLSLFLMTFRQIRYRDLNQLYAYNSALMLSRKVIRTLNL